MRKDGKTPYISHPFRVAFTVRHLFEEDDIVALCTALLHDVIEDTRVDFDELEALFGPEIARAVACLSKDKRTPEKERETAFYDQIARGPWQARLVKLADSYDNICDSATATAAANALDKGRLAIKAAGDDPRLRRAINLVEKLIEAKEKSDHSA